MSDFTIGEIELLHDAICSKLFEVYNDPHTLEMKAKGEDVKTHCDESVKYEKDQYKEVMDKLIGLTLAINLAECESKLIINNLKPTGENK